MTEAVTTTRHQRLTRLRDRFIAANLRSRSLRLQKPTRSGAFDLLRLLDVAGPAFDELLLGLGRKELRLELVDQMPADACARAVAADLLTLHRAAKLDEELTGARDLAVGWPLVEGRGNDGTWLRGPLLLYGAELSSATIGRRRWLLRIDAQPLLNAPLAQALDRAAGVRLSLDDLLGDDDNGACDEPRWSAITATLLKLGLPLRPPAAFLPVTALQTRSADERDALPKAAFTLTSSLVLGRFPRAGSTIAKDYDTLLTTALLDEDLGAAADLLGIDDASDPTRPSLPAASTTTTLATPASHSLGSRRFQVLPSDKSQDEVFAFLDQPSAAALVVQGPPGTGKSQLLTNLVVAAAAAGQRVLVVCQKRAALDVVAERLLRAGFTRPLALVHDVEYDRAPVTRAIAALIDAVTAVGSVAPSLTGASDVEEERQHRLQASQDAWRTWMTSKPGRPAAAILQERALGRVIAYPDVDVADAVTDAVTEPALRAMISRLEVLAPRAAAFASPHPLARRGDWSRFDEVGLLRGLRLVIEASHQTAQLLQLGTKTPLPQALAAAAALDLAEPTLAVLANEGSAQHSALLVFWGWTGGNEKKGLWKTTVTRLEKARKKLGEVPRELFSTSTATLHRWRDELAELQRLQTRWWRFCTPRFWRLRKTVTAVLQTAATLTTTNTTDAAAQAEAQRLLKEADKWHKLLGELPDHDVLALGLDGSFESIDNALLSLRAHHDHVAALHACARELGQRVDVEVGLHKPVDLGDDNEDGFVSTSLRVRAFLSAWRSTRQAVTEAAVVFDPREQLALQSLLERGLLQTATEHLSTFVDAALDGARTLAARARQAWALDQETRGDAPVLRSFLQRQPAGVDDVAVAFVAAVERAWLSQALDGRDPLLLENPLVDPGSLRRLADAHQRCQGLIAHTALAVLDDKLRCVAADKAAGRALRKLQAEVQKKRRQPTLRALTESYWGQGLDTVMPIWLCSPESAAALFPPRAGLFDLVIFDEASQCPVEAALPTLVRAKRAIIAGDDQQMPPSHFFQAAVRDEDEDEDDSAVLASHSVLDLARVVFPTTTLAWHYRSRDERLIAFSNAAFYANKLSSAPRAEGANSDVDMVGVDGFFFNRVPGTWVAQANPVEAQAVVDRVVELLLQPQHPTIGVIAFNQRHSELIEELLDERIAKDAAVAAAWSLMRQRPAADRVFVRNLENVQGDERDVVVVSPAYGPDQSGRVFARFGPLGQSGGEKRLNVAITRARRGIHVFCSFDPASLDVSASAHVGPKLFRLWLSTVAAAAVGNDLELRRLLSEAQDLGGARGIVDAAASNRGLIGQVVIEQLAQALSAQGLRVERGFGLGRQRLDLAVSRLGGPLRVGVDAGFLDEGDPLARDVYGPSFWQRAGWKVVRVTPASWADRDAVVRRVLDLL